MQPEEYRARAIENKQKLVKLGHVFRVIREDKQRKQTDTPTDILSTILRTPPGAK